MPLFSKLLFFGVLFFLPVLSFAQEDSYTLKGQLMVKGGDNYKYELVFTSNKGIVSGYSLTYLGGKEPSKASITGVIDKDKKTFSFRETKVLNGDREQAMCLVSCKLSYSQAKGKFIFLLKGSVFFDRVGADTQYDRSFFFHRVPVVPEITGFLSAAGCHVFRVKIQNNRFSLEIRK